MAKDVHIGMLKEIDGAGYARLRVPAADWERLAEGLANRKRMDFPRAGGPWGVVPAFGFYDQPRGGRLLGTYLWTQPKQMGTGDLLHAPPGLIVLPADWFEREGGDR